MEPTSDVFKYVSSLTKDELEEHRKEILKHAESIDTGFGIIYMIKHEKIS